MNIHEYQAKELFKKFDIPVPRGQVACTSGALAGGGASPSRRLSVSPRRP